MKRSEEQLAAYLKANAGEFLGLLIAGDLLLIALHWLYSTASILRPGFSSSASRHPRWRSGGQNYQYLKMFWIVLLLAGVGVRTGRCLTELVVLFLYLLLDDSLQLMSGRLDVASRMVRSAFHLRARIRELTVVGSVVSFCRSTRIQRWRGDRQFRRTSRDLALLVGVVGAFGVGVGTAPPDGGQSGSHRPHVALLEDGGEMFP